MELEHSFTVPVPRERAWEVLLDVERVAPCMPGATLDSVDGDAISGKIKVKVGPISMTYAGTARFTERDAQAGVVVLEASGKETRGAGTASAAVRSELHDQGGQTGVTVHTTLNVTGKPAQFGRGVMNEVSGKLIGIFATNLAAMLAAEQPGGTPEPAPAPGSSAASAGTAGLAAAGDGGTGRAQEPGAAGSGSPGGVSAEAAAANGSGPAVQSQPLEDLNLSVRSYNSLRREGVHTVGELAARTAQELLAIDNIGPASLEEIRRKLAELGLSLGETPGSRNGMASTGASAPAAAQAGAAAAAGGATSAAAPPESARPPASQADDDAIDLLSVAGLPVLKRAIPVLAALIAAGLVALLRRSRRRRRSRR
ncbi:MAG TPA: DNA-directed RNA polymerase subunit alpha C-terminal domain-containing protein [Streptosporangiaceae bacterium]